MSETEILGYVRESSTLDEFTFTVRSPAVSRVFKNSYVVIVSKEDPSIRTLARVMELESPIMPTRGPYIASCKVLATLNVRTQRLQPLLRPMRKGSSVLFPSNEQLSNFFRTLPPSLPVGKLSGFPNVEFSISLENFTKTSTLVVGMTGSGKTVTVLKILRGLVRNGLANFVFDIHGEYTDKLEESLTLIPGKNFTMDLNDQFLEAFSFWAKLSEVQVSMLYQSYALHPEDPDGMIRSLQTEADRPSFRVRAQMTIERALVRLQAAGLLSKKDAQHQEIHTDKGITVVDLSEVYLDYQPLLIDYILRFIFKRAKRNLENPLFIVLEEAHRFISKSELRIPAVRDIVFQGRKYCTSLCFVTQKPSLCDRIILSNCGLQLVHTLRNYLDLEALAEISEYIERSFFGEIPRLSVGEFLVFGPKIKFPAIARVG